MANEKDWQQDISTTVVAHTAKLSDHENRLNQAELNIADHETRIDNIETTTDVGQITLRVNAIEQKNTEQDSRLDNIDTKNTEQDATLTAYSERLDNIDTLNEEQNSKIKVIQDKDTEQDTKIVDLEKKSTIHDESINTINSIDSEQNARLTSLETKDSEQDKTIQDLSNVLTTKDNELKEKIESEIADRKQSDNDLKNYVNQTFVKTVNNIQADENGNITIVSNSYMPDYSASITKNHSTKYTAECDGYIFVQALTGAFENSYGGAFLYVYDSNDKAVLTLDQSAGINNAPFSWRFIWFIPISKGYKYEAKAQGVSSIKSITFIPCKG